MLNVMCLIVTSINVVDNFCDQNIHFFGGGGGAGEIPMTGIPPAPPSENCQLP